MIVWYFQALAETKRLYTPEKRREERRSDLPAYALYRPLSFWFTPLFMAMGWSANKVTVFSILVALSMPVAAQFGGSRAWALVAGLGVFFQILDCVDGNIARLRRTSGRVGHMLDTMSTLLFWTAYFIAIGVLAERFAPGFTGRRGIEIGLGLALLLLLHRKLEDTFEAHLMERITWTPRPGVSPEMNASGINWEQFGRPMEHIYAFGLLIVAGLWGWMDVFLGIMVFYQTMLMGAWLFRLVRAIFRHIGTFEDKT